MNAVHKRIRLRTQNPQEADAIAGKFKLSEIASRILAARGYKADSKLKHYITPSLKEGLPDPDQLRNSDAALEMIQDIIRHKGKIAICCDFDVDGLSGGAQLKHFFDSLGVKCEVFVPDRFKDGYGLNERILREAAKGKANLLICVDFGTRNHSELELARALGLQTIVLDHHHVEAIETPGDVFINPMHSDCGFAERVLCASGLAWYLIWKLKRGLKQAKDIDVKGYLDLACLGTICDMVPLIGANRVIAKRGLEFLATTERAGLQALKKVAGVGNKMTCSHVSFGIGPRLNAAGRMINGQMVVNLLTTDDDEYAQKLARKLNFLNLERQEVEHRVKEQAVAQIRNKSELPWGLVAHDKEFHTGVIGIVAQRLVEAFYRPSVVLGPDSDDVYKGSVRGIKGFSVVDTLAALSDLLIKYGGHEGAGGFSIKQSKLSEFEEAFAKACQQRLTQIENEPYVEADTDADIRNLEVKLINELEQFSPFGMGNPGPSLLFSGLKVTDVRVLKDAHLKATLSDGGASIAALMWRQTAHPALKKGQSVNVVGRPDSNSYRGNTEMQITLQAVEEAA